ncbi:MAG: UDP-N-acetylmuramate dehydrogenase [Parcubacteria group bacterium]|nr:UDP-N-acetylmuramate dehydrogenase [Parcubacteria group bacterium]
MKIEKDILLSPLTTFKVGGHASYFVSVTNIDELRAAFDFAENNALRTFILGGGSNIVFKDNGFDGLVIHVALRGIIFNDNEVEALAGESWDELVRESVARGYYTLANLSNIPGSVGAAPVQNIGAYGVELKDVLKSVEVFDTRDNKVKTLLNKDCKFTYRDSIFKNTASHLVVIKVVISFNENKPNISYRDLAEYFKEGEVPSPLEVRNAVIEIRSRKFPDLDRFGTAGSFFKNPIITNEKYSELQGVFPDLPNYVVDAKCVKIPLGFILDRLGLKGEKVGAIEVYEKQALVLINNGNGTFKDVKTLSEKIKRVIKEEVGIEIEKEVTFVK